MKGYEYLNSLMSDAKLLVQKKKKKQFKNLLCLSYFFVVVAVCFFDRYKNVKSFTKPDRKK